jgi:putative ABC transport system permease protein
MVTMTLRTLWARKRRLSATFLAVLLGVAFLAGTLALGDTLRANFADLFATVNQGTDAVVRGSVEIAASGRGAPDRARQPIDQSLVDRLRSVEGVAAAEPYVEGYGRILGADGQALGGNGPPTLAASWVADPELTPYRIVEGRRPQGSDEVVINRGAAAAGDLRVGDVTTVQTPEPVTVRIVGIATFGSADGLGQVTYAAFSLDAAQRLVFQRPGEITSILVKGDDGLGQSELVARIRSVLPQEVEAITGEAAIEEATGDINRDFLDMLRGFLLVFAGVALAVAAFSIHNTFSILAAQRTRESALLRALGATRGQVLRSLAVEALVIGVAASAAGVAAGLGVAGLLKGMFDAFGFSLPAGGLTLTGTSAGLAFAAGVVVAVVAGVGPAVKASRVLPLAAIRDVDLDRAGSSTARAVAGVAVAAVGVLAVLTAVLGDGDNVLARAGTGAALVVIGLVVLGPLVARTAAGALGAPLPRLRGITGALARQNAMRNPRRAAGSASALMVGVGVVTLFTVFAASLKASVNQSVSESVAGDLVISAGRFGGGGLSPQLARDVAAVPGVEAAVGLGRGAAVVDGTSRAVTIADPAPLQEILDEELTASGIAAVSDGQLAVSEDLAEDHGWRVGSIVPVRFIDGETVALTVGAIYGRNEILSDVFMPRSSWAPHSRQDIDGMVLIAVADAADRESVESVKSAESVESVESVKVAVSKVAETYGAPSVQDRDEYAASAAQGIDQLLGIVYVLLFLAIVIAVMGIGNTLSLSLFERRRELGLLRVVGQTRRQLRSMVRWESVLVALLGTIGGLGLGLFLGWALVQAASAAGLNAFAAPPAQLLVVAAAGAVAGVAAAVRPARRAARLPVLDAVAAGN